MKRIILTGGGTAGHVTPNLALIPRLLEDGWDVHYVGEANSVEQRLTANIPVSYTHLDVYKRQVQGGFVLSERGADGRDSPVPAEQAIEAADGGRYGVSGEPDQRLYLSRAVHLAHSVRAQ